MRSAVRLLLPAMLVAWIGMLSSCGAVDEPKATTAPTEAKPATDAKAPTDAPKDQDWPPKGVKVEGTDDTKAPPKPEPKAPTVDMKKVSYCLGLAFGHQAKTAGVDIQVAEMTEGIKTGMEGGKARFTDQEITKIMQEFQEYMMAQQEAKAAKLAAENKAKGDAYLADNKKKEGVKVTASGLQYRVVKAGTGKQPKTGDSVTVHYKGTFVDGLVFDSSYDHPGGEPVTFTVGQVIPGWNEALVLMREGDQWELVIPANLAYGEDGNRGIPPNSVLVFTVDLKKVEEAPKIAPPEMPEMPKK